MSLIFLMPTNFYFATKPLLSTAMPTPQPKTRFVLFAFVVIFQLLLHVGIGLSIYAAYKVARYILLETLNLLPYRVLENLWQVAVILIVLG